MKIAFALICASTVAAAPSARAVEKPAVAAKCFSMSDVRNHTVGDEHTLYLNVAGRSVYRVDMRNNCLGGMSSTDPIELKSHGSGSICGAEDLDIGASVNGGGLPSRCIVDTLSRLTPSQAAALPAKVKP